MPQVGLSMHAYTYCWGVGKDVMSDRCNAAQISIDWVLIHGTKAALEAFPALLPDNFPLRQKALTASPAKFIEPVLVGPANKIRAVAETHDLDIRGFEIVEAQHGEEFAEGGVQLIEGVTPRSLGLRTARRIRCPHKAADLYPGKRRRRLCRLGR